MKAATILALIVATSSGWAQIIVLKSTFPKPPQYSAYSLFGMEVYPEIDVNDDGTPDVPVRGNGCYYLDLTTMQVSGDRADMNWSFAYPQEEQQTHIAKMRRNGIAEFIEFRLYGPQVGVYFYDVWTGDPLLACPECAGGIITDYDNDGLDDVIVSNGPNLQVYGIANGNPVNPPQDLNIHISGDDYVITWNSVSGATAYRVLWSSSIDGVYFTRIGYTTGTTFTHRNQADQPKGFYRVMSEDNGTGVVRMIGQTAGADNH